MERSIEDARSQLVGALTQNGNHENALDEIVQADVSFQKKLETLDTEWIKHEIIGNEEGLSYLVDVVRYLRDTGLYICSNHNKSTCYSPIPAGKESVFKQTVYSHLSKFSRDVVKMLGYTEEKNDNLLPSYPMETSLLKVVPIVTADLMIMTKELEMYLNKSHPHPHRIIDVLPEKLRGKQKKPGYADMRKRSDCSKVSVVNNAVYDLERPVPAPRKHNSPRTGVCSSLSLLSPGGSTCSSTSSSTPSDKTSNRESAQSKDCELCGRNSATVSCSDCDNKKQLCDICDRSWHAHVKRRQHQRQQLHQQQKTSELVRANRRSVVIVPGKRGLSSRKESYGANSQAKKKNDQQADFRELSDELEAKTGLSERMKKVMEMLENRERLGGIKYGLEVSGVKERIHLLKEQEFLRNYQENLSNQLRDYKTSTGRQSSKPYSHKQQTQNLFKKESEDGQKKGQNVPAPLGEEIDEIYVQDVPVSRESLMSKTTSKTSNYSSSEYFYDYVSKISPQDCSERRQASSSSTSQMSLSENTSDNCDSGEEDELYEYVETKNSQSACSVEESHDGQTPIKIQPAIDNQLYDDIPKCSGHSDPPRPKPRITMSTSFPNSNNSSWKMGWPQPWECEHCTFHNVRGSRVCATCYRTSDRPVLLEDDTPRHDLPRPPPPRHTMSLPTENFMKEMDQLDALAVLRKQYSKTAQSASHEELLAELHQNLESGNIGIKYMDSPVRSSFLRLSTDDPTCHLLSKLKEADQENFTVEEFQIARQHSGDIDPTKWLRTVWKTRVQSVIDSVTRELKCMHLLAQLSQEEARLALIEALGNFDTACLIASSRWKEMYEELITNFALGGSHTSEEKDIIVRAMNQSHGNIAKASLELFQETKSLDMLNNIWAKDVGCYINERESVCDKPYHLVADDSIPEERRLHILMAEFNLDTLDKAKNVLIIWMNRHRVSDSLMLADVIEAVRNCSNITKALSYLQQDCAVCGGQFPASKIQILSFCQCKLCTDCLKQHFALVVREKQVSSLVCPKCGKPDVKNHEEFEAHLQLLMLMLKHHLAEEEMYLLDKKVTDWSLMQDPNFRWCSYDDCCCGFVFNRQHPHDLIMECPECSRLTCFECRIPWEEEHTHLTCEQFALLKSSQEFSTLDHGAASFIQNCGIECPKCHCRYAIAKGGCLHFTCSQCHHEFCSGCNKPFSRGQECTFLPICASLGLHCHHPRSCLYYLGGESTSRLQKLLRDHGIPFLVDGVSKKKKQNTCPVIELKDTNHDEPCGKQVLKQNAGLCETHYKEYLITLINQNDVDPVSMMTNQELQKQFERVNREIPKRLPGEKDEKYHERLIMLVKQQIPLTKLKKPSVFVSRT